LAEDAKHILVDPAVEVFTDGLLVDVELFRDQRVEDSGGQLADVDRHEAAPG